MEPKHSPLEDFHLELGAKLIEFGGWKMPIAYPMGTIEEHLSCRRSAVWFDVSHLGTVRVSGTDAFGSLQHTFTNDLTKIAPGRAQYTHLLNDQGFVEDDIIVWWIDEEHFDVMPNASNTDRVLGAINGDDITATRAIIAIQGPHARNVVQEISTTAANVPHFGVTEFTFEGERCVAAGTGYTGEDGIECAIPAEVAPNFAKRLTSLGLLPAGLGARDTLRLEAGLPLHGHELGEGITPLQARLGWVVAWDKEFIGRDALLEERTRGVARLLYGLQTEDRRPLREGCEVRFDRDHVLGETTSGNYSPVLEHGIAFAFLPPRVEFGEDVIVDVRGREVGAKVVKVPFVKKDAST